MSFFFWFLSCFLTAIALPHASPWPPRSPFTTWESATPSRRARLVITPRHSAITTRPRCRSDYDRNVTTTMR
ncbi:hypothetical protein EDB85DRAFT_2036694 [Lactarius pseudohatsudake]|nr:hypothetical protein EDB85DRAFT_2036694 [Lactarius pseudohatsudake]